MLTLTYYLADGRTNNDLTPVVIVPQHYTGGMEIVDLNNDLLASEQVLPVLLTMNHQPFISPTEVVGDNLSHLCGNKDPWIETIIWHLPCGFYYCLRHIAHADYSSFTTDEKR